MHNLFLVYVFRQPVHVSGVSRPIIRRYKYNHMDTIGTYYTF